MASAHAGWVNPRLPEAHVKIVVYTALIGDCDGLLSRPGGDAVAFVTHTHAGATGWEQRVVPAEWGPRRTARHYKALPHRYMPDADVWIWIDGNVQMSVAPEEAAARWLKGDLATFNHWERDCLYDEAAFCAKIGKDAPQTLRAQTRRYEAAGMPRHWGLAATRVMIRRNMPEMAMLNEAWWAEIERGSVRDQVSLPYVCWKAGIRWDVLPGKLVPGMRGDFSCTRHVKRGRT